MENLLVTAGRIDSPLHMTDVNYAEEEALKRGMEENFREFSGKGGELYAKA
ncbi:MAG: hypothetical protein KJ072_11340 [Verrucomicrobia bacterium]|nr:hypothetical protein [Verrucomicrobiota bacterium]